MEVVAAWVLGLVAIFLQAGVAPVVEVERLVVNLPVVWVVWVGLRRDAEWTFSTVLVLGVAAGLLGGVARGPYLVALFGVALATVWIRPRLQHEGIAMSAGWTAVMACLFDFLFLAGVVIASSLPWAGDYLLRTTPVTALLTAVASVVTAPLLGLIGRLSAGRNRGLQPLRPR